MQWPIRFQKFCLKRLGLMWRSWQQARSDYPNQINNVLCFPGLFKGALDCLATHINEEMKMAAAHAIADCIAQDHLQPEYIIPSVFDTKVVENVSAAVIKVARKSKAARMQKQKSV